ncbi:MAG: ATP-dependent DNA helicase [Planctomycetota bacterium]
MVTPADILGPNGRIAKRVDRYETRDEQMRMAAAVADAFKNRHHLLVEAGTGVGKSFAYLVPAILAATEPRDEDAPPLRVVVSTHTISLQEQLITKDLPLLNAVIPREFTAVLVKGRGNYISMRRLEQANRRTSSLFAREDEVQQLRRITQWANASGDGSLSDLGFRPAGTVWDEVASDSSNCLGRGCRHRDKCFYYRARSRVHNAQILVVNHALFFSDLALRSEGGSILPNYQAVVFDEAHTLESVAAGHLGLGVSSGQVEFALNKLYNDKTNKGLLVHYGLPAAQEQVLACHHRSDELFDQVCEWHERHPKANGRVRTANTFDEQLSPALADLAKSIRNVAEEIEDPSDHQELSAIHDRLLALAAELKQWTKQSIPEAVYWTEVSTRRHRKPRVMLSAAPLDIGPVLRDQLFERVPTVVMTSATLAVSRPPSFTFFRSRIGLTQANELKLGSPFEYRKQARLVILEGMPDPNTQRVEYERQCAKMICRYVEQTEGRAFVLFTSYALMRQMASQLTTWLAQQNLALYSQSEGTPRTQMLQQFKDNPRAVLFGTNSFWQGVDVPGDALQNVIITKLPFSVPDQPLIQARLETIRKAGRNPFLEYQVPEAVIKLRQGFGRLIRSRSDHGMVVILDPRVRTKPYGRVFLESLPDCRVVVQRC